MVAVADKVVLDTGSVATGTDGVSTDAETNGGEQLSGGSSPSLQGHGSGAGWEGMDEEEGRDGKEGREERNEGGKKSQGGQAGG